MAAAAVAVLTTDQWLGVVVGIVAVCFVVGYVFAVQSHRITGSYPWHMPPIFWGVIGGLLPVLGFVVESIARVRTPATDVNTAAGGAGTLDAADPRWAQGTSDQAPDTYGAQQAGAAPGASDQPAPGLPQQQAPSPQGPYGPAGAPTGPWGNPGWQGAQWQPPPQAPPAPGQPPNAPVPGAPQGAPPYPPGQWPTPLGPESFPQAAAGPADWQPAFPQAAVPAPPPLFGWYPDPTGRHEQRYWDGRQWSNRVADDSVRSDDPEGAV